MGLFLVTHKWKEEDRTTVIRKIIEALQQIPEGASLCFSYVEEGQKEAWCIWEAKSAEQVKDFLTEKVPEMENKVNPVLQWFPPAPDIYTFIHTLVT